MGRGSRCYAPRNIEKGSRFLSAFLRCHGEKGGGLLMYVFAATFWTFDVAFFVFRKSKGYFKWLLATFAVEFIARHGDLRKSVRAAGLLIYGVRSRIAGVKASSYLEGGQFPVTALIVQVLIGPDGVAVGASPSTSPVRRALGRNRGTSRGRG